MIKQEVTINELYNMLVTTKVTMKKDKPLMLASSSKSKSPRGAKKGSKRKKSSSLKDKQPLKPSKGVKKKKEYKASATFSTVVR